MIKMYYEWYFACVVDLEEHTYLPGFMREPFFQNVCNGNLQGKGFSNSTKIQTKCHFVHHFNPFTILGPFHIEVQFYQPFRTIIHDFFTENEMDWMMTFSKPRLSASRAGTIPESTKQLSTSERRYGTGKGITVSKAVTAWFNDINYTEKEQYTRISAEGAPLRYDISPLKDPYNYTILHKVMYDVSQRMERATQFNVTSRHGASLYQSTNYGLSGMVNQHLDPWGYEMGVQIPEDRRVLVRTGDYIATFMGWFEDTAGGGGTAFFPLNPEDKGFESVVMPTKGSAAFWINLASCHVKDYRAFHAGCPVLKGSKWILNKWIYSWDQWKAWPCDMERARTILPFAGMSS